jgi:tRNA(Ile)-lysidine synthase
MPQLAALGLDARRLAQFAVRMRHADRAIAWMAAQAPVATSGKSRSVSVDALRRVPRAVAVKVVGGMLRDVGQGAKAHDLAAVEALTDRLIREPVRNTLHNCLVGSDGETVSVAPEPGRAAARKARVDVTAN